MTEPGPRIVAFSGSVRPGNYTSMALAVVVEAIRTRGIPVEVFLPADLRLPPPGMGISDPDPRRIQEAVRAATGVVLATPEYHGGLSSVTKLVIENLGFPSALAGKPVALVGVAAGEIGAVKSLESMQSICAHVGAIVLPGMVSVPKVRDAFAPDGRCTDPRVEKRLRSAGGRLLDYIEQNICPRITLEAMVRSGE